LARQGGQRTRPDSRDRFAFAPEPIRRIGETLGDLTIKQKILARFMLQHPEKIGFLSIRDLADQIGVSTATVSRLCSRLGYAGYDEFGREVQQSLQYEMSTPARLRMLNDVAEQASDPPQTAFDRVVEMETQNLLLLRSMADREALMRCVEVLHDAESVFVVGSMGSTALAEYLAYALGKVRRAVRLASSGAGSSDWLAFSNVGPGTLVVLIGFPRYQRRTIDIGKYAKARGASILAVTDQESSPLARLADLVIPVPITLSTVVDSFAAPIVLIHGLVVEYGERYREEVQQQLIGFEQYTRDLSIWPETPTREPATPGPSRTRR
jgi:DNA-binding MurR/RpiR family transcriptional regulator